MFDSPEAYLKTAAAWVEAQYSGPRAALRPLDDKVKRWLQKAYEMDE